jgi:hypothetical protein
MDVEDAVREHWESLLADAAATAGELRERGWEVLELHPGDVTVDADRVGLDVLVPDNEFEQLETVVAETDLDEHDVYRTVDGAVFLLVVARDDDRKRAVCCPAYYNPAAAVELQRRAREAGHLRLHLRVLSGETVTLTVEGPELFFTGGE